MLFEVICAIIYAPIMMVQQTLAVFSAVSGRAATWSPQARGVEGYDLSTTLRFHKVETLLGFSLSFGIASGTVPLSLLPVALPLLLAVALSMLGSVSIAKAKLSWMRLESPQALRVPRIVKRANEERAKMQRALETPEPIAIAAE
jgi:membrane glycosyltransferase